MHECNGVARDGNRAKQGLHYSLHIVVRLVLGREHLVEHVHSFLTAILLSCPWTTVWPAECHSEEMCEAMLSRLSSCMCRPPEFKLMQFVIFSWL